MQMVRQIVRVLKTPVTLLLLLAFVGYGAAWGYEHAKAPAPGRPPVPCVATDVGDTLTPPMVQVRVLNGGTQGGMAKNAASHLRAFDFKVIKYGNTDERLENTIIVGKNAEDPQVQLLTYFFKDADVERLLGIVMAVAMENAVTRQRLDALERLVEQKGLLTRAELEQFAPDRDAEAERTLWMKEYIARVLRIVQQETEAIQGGAMDVPMEEVMDELR